MLGVDAYPKKYIDSCRTLMKKRVEAWRALEKAAKKPALQKFEPAYFNDLVLVLEQCFVHRLRGQEGKDGNPLNEVRLLARSLLEHGGKLTEDNTISYKSSRAVLGLEPGDEIALNADQFETLAEAFFAELKKKFS